MRKSGITVLQTEQTEEESDDEKWTLAILVPLGCRRMRVNSRRLQPFGGIISVADVPKPGRGESTPKPSNGQQYFDCVLFIIYISMTLYTLNH
jgi:hypothetical protein